MSASHASSQVLSPKGYDDMMSPGGNRSSISGDQSYDKMMKTLMHASSEKSIMLQEIQSLKASLKEAKKEIGVLESEAVKLSNKNKLLISNGSSSSSSQDNNTNASLRPAPGTSYTTEGGEDVVVMRSTEVLSSHKLLETNLRTGIMATLWAIKAQLTKRLCSAFSRWRLTARLLTKEVETESKMLKVWHESEEAIRSARAVGGAVGGDAASKVWMGTAMKLLALQRKKEDRGLDTRSQEAVAVAAAAAAALESAGSAACEDMGAFAAVGSRARPRRSNIMLKPVPVLMVVDHNNTNTSDMDLDPSKFTATQYQHLHDHDNDKANAGADASNYSKPTLHVQTFGLLHDDGTALAEHSDDEEEKERRRPGPGSGGSEHGWRGGDVSSSSYGSSRGPRFMTPTQNSQNGSYSHHRGDNYFIGRSASPGGGGVGSISEGGSIGSSSARNRRRVVEVTAKDIQQHYKQQYERQVAARKAYSLRGLRERSKSPSSVGAVSFFDRSQSHSAPQTRAIAAAVSSTGAKYSRKYNALRAGAAAAGQNFWGSEYTKETMQNAGNSFKNSPRNSPRGSPSVMQVHDTHRASSVPPNSGSERQFSNFPSTAAWAASVLQRGNGDTPSGGYDGGSSRAESTSGTRSRSASARKGGKSNNHQQRFANLGHFAAETETSRHHHVSRNQQRHLHEQHVHEYSAQNAHFMSHATPLRGAPYSRPGVGMNRYSYQNSASDVGGSGSGYRSSDGGHARRMLSAQNRQMDIARGNWERNHLDQHSNSPHSGRGHKSEPKHSMLRDGGSFNMLITDQENRGRSRVAKHGQGRAQRGNYSDHGHHSKVTHSLEHGHFMMETASSRHHVAPIAVRKHIHEQYEMEYSPEHAHSMAHVKPVKSHAGNGADGDQYLNNDDHMNTVTYRKFRGELETDMHMDMQGLTSEEVKEAEAEIELMLSSIEDDQEGMQKQEHVHLQVANVEKIEVIDNIPSPSPYSHEPTHHEAESGKHVVEILAQGLERKRHAKSAVAERLALMSAKAAGNTNVNTSESIQAQTVSLHDEVNAVVGQ